MARSTPSAVTTAFRAQFVEPIFLVHIQTGATSPSDVYFCTGDGDVEMGGVTWSARPISLGDTNQESHQETPPSELMLADGDGYWKTLLDAGAEFQGQRITIYHTNRSALGSANPLTDAVRDDFKIDTWDRAHGEVAIHLKSRVDWGREIPKRTITKREFPGIPPVNALV